MRRGIFNVLVAVSLLLCISSIAMWALGKYTSDLLELTTWSPNTTDCRRWEVDLGATERKLFLNCERTVFSDPTAMASMQSVTPSGFRYAHASISPTLPWDALNEGYRQWVVGYLPVPGADASWSAGRWRAVCPIWAATVITGLLPFTWTFRKYRSLQIRGNQVCRKCGYDLRATPDRCPECGANPKFT